MISEQFKQGIDQIFCKAVKKSIIRDVSDTCDIQPWTARSDLEKADIFVLTISSLLFRVLTIFHIDDDPQTRDYFLKSSSNTSFDEIFYEISNMNSGVMNQELLRYFSHLGMSTPYKLNGGCLSYLSELNSGYISRHAITINGSIRLHATLCMSGYAPVDFTFEETKDADTSGELEFF